jgi:hypothetical protein
MQLCWCEWSISRQLRLCIFKLSACRLRIWNVFCFAHVYTWLCDGKRERKDLCTVCMYWMSFFMQESKKSCWAKAVILTTIIFILDFCFNIQAVAVKWQSSYEFTFCAIDVFPFSECQMMLNQTSNSDMFAKDVMRFTKNIFFIF